jgi:hypothetical protein
MRNDPRVLSHGPVRARVGACEVTIPYQPAAVWVQAVRDLPGLVSRLASTEAREVLLDQIMDHPTAVADMEREAHRILSEVSGWKWWEAVKLINTSTGREVLGRLVLAGVDPWQCTLGEWCAATYALCVKGADAQARLKTDFSLSLPPPGVEDGWDDDGDDAEATMSAVQALMGQG